MMKSVNIKKSFKISRLLLVLSILLILIKPALSQSDSIEKQQPKMKFSYLKNSDGSKSLISEINVKIEKERFLIKDLPVTFYYSGDSSLILGTLKTNNSGVALFKINPDVKLPANEEGFFSFKASFEGNVAFESVEEELQVRDIQLDLVFTEDSLKTITVNANEIVDGEKKPVEGPTIIIYVQRSLGLLKIKSQPLTGGSAEFEFPGDLPGDEDGNLTIIAKIEDDENFGNVEKATIKKWGIPLKIEAKTNSRELWSPDAPLWMSITLFILILAVIIHYFIIFYKLYVINKEGKTDELKK